jgi:hypothetical protein
VQVNHLGGRLVNSGFGFGEAPKQPLRPVPARVRQRGLVDQREDLRESAVRMLVPVPGVSHRVIMVAIVVAVVTVVVAVVV